MPVVLPYPNFDSVYQQEYLNSTEPPRAPRSPLNRQRIIREFPMEDYRSMETLEQVIQRLHRRQKFYLTHAKDLPSW